MKKNRLLKMKNIFFVLLVIILTITLLLIYSPIEIVAIRGNSMNPTLSCGDRVIVITTEKAIENIEYKNIVIFTPPKDPSQKFVKRVIAMEKEEYVLKEGGLVIDGIDYCEGYIACSDYPVGNSALSSGVVPENKVYLLGDNRISSNDSRWFGYVCSTCVQGKVLAKVWPLSEIEWFNN